MAGRPSGEALRSIGALFNAGTIVGLTDGQLLERFNAHDGDGDDLAFAGLVERHGPMVLRVCRALLRDAHEAEDAFQATFLILAIKARSIRGRDSMSSWLYSVAYNVAASARSSSARRRAHELKAGQARAVDFSEAAHDDLGPALHEELDRLPERYRAVLVLCHLEGLTQHQAAERLGWPVGTVQSRLARGRDRLRARLSRRGLGPTAAVLTAPGPIEAVPAALADSTTRLALTIGTVPEAVMHLVNKGVKSMFVNKLMTTCLAALLAVGAIATGAFAYQAAKPEPDDARSEPATKADDRDDGLLTVVGVVRLPDGAPAAGATVRAFSETPETSPVAHTDEAGRFELRGVFGGGCDLHASSADGSLQTVLKTPSAATRDAFAVPVELTLQPAIDHEVDVLSGGKPVSGATIMALAFGLDTNFQVQGVTGQDGKARLRLPADQGFNCLVAWHPVLGVGARGSLRGRLLGKKAELSLLPPAPHTIRVVDPDGNPVPGLELGVHFATQDSEWLLSGYLTESHVRTGVDGMATIAWAPRGELRYVQVEFPGSDWKVDETDLKQIKNGLTTVHARREHTVQGRLIMPEGVDAEGILVTGFGFGPANMGDRPFARARRDGTFRLQIPSNHGFSLGIVDSKWASEPWTGVILRTDSSEPAEIAVKVYPATPITVRVNRGSRREPVADAVVQIESMAEFDWTDVAGEKHSAMGGAGNWLTTDADGMTQAAVGRGKQRLTMLSGDWRDQREIEVTSEKPVEVVFHRPWIGRQRIKGRLTLNGAHYPPSPTLRALAWASVADRNMIPPTLKPIVNPDGTFEVAFDAEAATLLFLDGERRLAGFAEKLKASENVDVRMMPTATYAGTLLDPDGKPASGRTVEMFVRNSDLKPIAARRTDEVGRFRFDAAPSNVPLQLRTRLEPDAPEEYIFDGDRLFTPGEAREKADLKLQRSGSSLTKPRPVAPLSERVESLCKKVGPSGMRGLVAVMGDDSGDAARTVDSLFDYNDERMKDVLGYLTLRVEPAETAKEAATIAGRGWPSPKPGEVVLVAVDGEGKTIAAETLALKNVEAAIDAGAAFMKRHRLPSHDARALLADARAEAKRSGRRVWVIEGGPRCGPCFMLARWIKDHHAVIDKDYVVVKLMEALDDHVPEAVAGLPIEDGDGIPWFAITEPDGVVLAHSRGPLGNIGFPSSLEGIRHFRTMLEQTTRKLTADEIERLVGSLSSDHD